MSRVTLTTQLVKSTDCPKGKKKIELFDIASKGLSLEVRATGGKTYYQRYRDSRRRIRQIKLGDERDLSLADARLLANKVGRQVAMGEDPLGEKQIARTVPTFADFIADQYLPYIRTYKRSWGTDVSLLKNHLLPRFGKKYMDEITRQEIIKMHADRKASGAAAGSANRLLIMMRFVFNLALRWEVPGIKTNPCKAVPLLEENNKRERYLSVEEAQKLYGAVCASDNKMLRFIVPMLILTGARKREVLDAKWDDFDLVRKVWRIPITKSGKSRRVPLSDGALTLLATMPRKFDCPWAFANPDTGKPYVSIFYAWNSARKKVGLEDICIHSLRHSHASFLINAGRTLYEVQNILGHSQVKTTQRYAHLSQDTLLAATNAASNLLDHVFSPVAIPLPSTTLTLGAHHA
jgi:integrase